MLNLQNEPQKINQPTMPRDLSERSETLQYLRLRRRYAITCLGQPFDVRRSRCLDRLDGMIERMTVQS